MMMVTNLSRKICPPSPKCRQFREIPFPLGWLSALISEANLLLRRYFFRQAGFGIGSAALSTLLNRYAVASAAPRVGPESVTPANPLAPRPPHFAPKAKSVIYLFMAGAPSQVDLLDFKPKLQELDGQHVPEELLRGERFD